jgi:branched-chain amino acid transport system substrate-binding protein
MAITGAYAGNGKAALLLSDVGGGSNREGGLLGRPVELIYYDDQSNPSSVPGIYTKHFDIDKVDFVISGYGTNIIAPAMPLVMQHKKVYMSLAGMEVNNLFHYDKYFQIYPFGPNARLAFSEVFDVAMKMNPKPKTVAISVAIRNFTQTAAIGARHWAKKYGLQIVYDRSFPANTVDSLQFCAQFRPNRTSYILMLPPNTVGIVRGVRRN